MTSNSPRFMTLEQTAAYLNVPLSYVYRQSSLGTLVGRVTLGGSRQVRVDRLRLEAWLEEQVGGQGR